MPSNADHTLLEKLQSAVESNLTNEQFGVEMLADIVAMSRSGLHRKLKELTGQSVSQFIREYRLQKARDLLSDKDLSISEVAYRVGFNSATYFTKSFSDYYGFPPGETKFKSSPGLGDEATVAPSPAGLANPLSRMRYNWKLVTLSLLTAVLVLFVGIIIGRKNIITASPEKSIAILPFKNQSADAENQYFADGVMDAILNKLSRVKSLKVISRTSVEKFRDSQLTIPEIAEELDVAFILEGSAQKYGNVIKVVTQLIDAKQEGNIWSQDFTRDFNDIFALQSEIAENITAELKAALSIVELEQLNQKLTSNPEAYDYFMKGDYQRKRWDKKSLDRAIPLFEKAIELDSQFTDAYVGLAYVYIVGGSVWGIYTQEVAEKRAFELLEKAVSISPNHFEANNVLGASYFFYQWDCQKALYHFNKTKEINGYYGNFSLDFFTKMGRFEEAEEAIRHFMETDPLDATYISFMAQLEGFKGQIEKATKRLDEGLMLYDESHFLMREGTKLYYTYGEFEKARKTLASLKKNVTVPTPLIIWLEAGLSYHYGEDPKPFVKELESMYTRHVSGSPAWFLALYWFEAGDLDQGFLWLEKSFQSHEVEITWMNMELVLQPHKNDLRYQKIYQQVGFLNPNI